MSASLSQGLSNHIRVHFLYVEVIFFQTWEDLGLIQPQLFYFNACSSHFLWVKGCKSPVAVNGLLSYHDWHLHLILTHQPLLAFLDESEGQCHTHSSAGAYMESQVWVCMLMHRCTHKGRPLHISAHSDIFVVFCVKRQCLPVLKAAVSGSVWTVNSWPPGCETLIFMSAKEMESPFSLSAIVRVCVQMAKAVRRQEGLALLWTLSLYYKSLPNGCLFSHCLSSCHAYFTQPCLVSLPFLSFFGFLTPAVFFLYQYNSDVPWWRQTTCWIKQYTKRSI